MAIDGTIQGDNSEIARLNSVILELKKKLESGEIATSIDEYILDFEEYNIDILFSENKKRARITVTDNAIVILIGENEVKVSSDGTVI